MSFTNLCALSRHSITPTQRKWPTSFLFLFTSTSRFTPPVAKKRYNFLPPHHSISSTVNADTSRCFQWFVQNLESLLQHVADVVDKHTDSEVLENCSRVMESVCNDEYSIATKCRIAQSQLVDNIAQKYKDAFRDFFSGVSTKLHRSRLI